MWQTIRNCGSVSKVYPALTEECVGGLHTAGNRLVYCDNNTEIRAACLFMVFFCLILVYVCLSACLSISARMSFVPLVADPDKMVQQWRTKDFFSGGGANSKGWTLTYYLAKLHENEKYGLRRACLPRTPQIRRCAGKLKCTWLPVAPCSSHRRCLSVHGGGGGETCDLDTWTPPVTDISLSSL